MTSHRSIITATESIDQPKIAQRYGVGAIFKKEMGLDGIKFIFICESVNKIDRFFMEENSECITRSEKNMIDDLIKFEDTLLNRPDLIALDHLLAQMVITGADCKTLQGVRCV